MFNPSRDQARRFFIDAWHKRLQKLPLTPMEVMTTDVIQMHPEYHTLFGHPGDDIEELLVREWTPEQGEGNPFLHLSLHLAIAEQLSIDQPPGIRDICERLQKRHGEPHAALHDILECLAETLWHSQHNHAPPDGAAYLDCMRRKI